ncbi:MAG: hypothetical protein U0869_21905 [Chloroflexota bacterium]
MSSPVLEAARAEREQLEERCAWHRGQLDRLEQQLEALKEIERLAERLGHGTAGEAPPATAPGGGVSPARSVPTGAGARQRPAQRTAAGPAPKPHSHESGRQRREQVLDAIGQGHGKPAEISEATGIAKGGLKYILRSRAGKIISQGVELACLDLADERFELGPLPAPSGHVEVLADVGQVVAVGGGPAGDTVALQAGADEPLAVAVSDDADPDVPAVGPHAPEHGTDSRILFRGVR